MEVQPQGIVAIFYRMFDDCEHFYPIQFMGSKSPADEAADHAALNPGTLRVEDVAGNILWQQETV